jgi:hypothetical protein
VVNGMRGWSMPPCWRKWTHVVQRLLAIENDREYLSLSR